MSDGYKMMKCGHTATGYELVVVNGTQQRGRSCCVTCSPKPEAYEEAPQPDLAGRIAVCSYNGSCKQRQQQRGDTSYAEGYDPQTGQAWAKSNINLPFFEFQGDGSPWATEFCVCGSARHLHLPAWRYKVVGKRQWFGQKDVPWDFSEIVHCQTLDDAKIVAQAEAQAKIEVMSGKDTGFSEWSVASVVSCNPSYRPHPCGNFRPRGPSKTDKFFCGCFGWD